jgi:hypothetical protein
MTKATNLTQHGIKQLSESKDLAREYASTQMIFQLSDVNIFDASA